jgi:hypothetical protein
MVYDVDKDRWWGKEAYNGKRKGFRFSWLRIEDIEKAMRWAKKMGEYVPECYAICSVTPNAPPSLIVHYEPKRNLIHALS